jgi:hypothetical protein
MTIGSWFDIYDFTPGRVGFSAKQIAAVARQVGDEEVAAEAEPVRELARRAVALERKWQSGQLDSAGRGGGRAVALDHEVDRLVGGVYKLATTYRTAAKAESPTRVAAEAIVKAGYPQGAAAITRQTYEDQATSVDVLLGQLKGELAEPVQQLGLASMVDMLGTAQAAFKDALATPRPEQVGFDQVRAAREAAREGLAQLIALILGKYRKTADLETRNTLLAPVVDQNERIADSYQRRRTVPDVDPETGQDVEAPTGE